jgi:beta-lactamase class A
MRKQIIIYIFAFFVGLVSGIMLANKSKNQDPSSALNQQQSNNFVRDIEYRESGFHFTSPLLDCDGGQALYQVRISALKQKIQKIIDEKHDQKKASSVAVYFRDLNNGPWFGINEEVKFAPASLMKVPVMIAYYRLAETNPELLEKKIELPKNIEESYDQYFPPSQKIKPGASYTINELLFNMIAYSDNDALTALLQNIDQQYLLQSYTDLGVIIPGAKNLDDELSVKEYSSFFRILYNASFLNRDYSEQALQNLSRSDFQKGIAAGISSNIEVAHKFGERFIETNGEPTNQNSREKQLHDCGIVYVPNHPYLICIMSKGDNFDDLSQAIQEISHVIHEDVLSEK